MSSSTETMRPAPHTTAPATAAGRLSRLAGGARRYGFALAALAAVAIGLAVLWATGAFTHGHGHEAGGGPVAPRTSAPVGDLSVAVMGVQRLRDGHAGVNSPKLPMNGPAMPMSSMGEIGGAPKAGQEQIAVTVTLRNPTDEPVAFDAGKLLLVKNGREVPLLRPTRSTLGDGTLRTGSQISGSIFYVIKAGTAPLALRHVDADTVFTLDNRTSVPGAKPAAKGKDDGRGH